MLRFGFERASQPNLTTLSQHPPPPRKRRKPDSHRHPSAAYVLGPKRTHFLGERRCKEVAPDGLRPLVDDLVRVDVPGRGRRTSKHMRVSERWGSGVQECAKKGCTVHRQ
eukprot:1977880-Rhodomonas_salina.2